MLDVWDLLLLAGAVALLVGAWFALSWPGVLMVIGVGLIFISLNGAKRFGAQRGNGT